MGSLGRSLADMLLTPAEAAEIVGVTVHAVYNLADRVHLPPHGPKHARRRYEGRGRGTVARAAPPAASPAAPVLGDLKDAAEVPGMSKQATGRAMKRGALAHRDRGNGRRYMRRPQLEVIAHARDSSAPAVASRLAQCHPIEEGRHPPA
jgi:hypothetical protein